MAQIDNTPSRFRRDIVIAGFIAGLALIGIAESKQWSGGGNPPIEGFRQIIPRGRIAAIVDPQFVTADKARMPENAWVLGFVIDGQAYAYDLNMLNAHEIVNHTVNDKPIAAVW